MPIDEQVDAEDLVDNNLYQSIYIDAGHEDWNKRIVFHDPVFEDVNSGVIALKSLMLENTRGFVVGGEETLLEEFRKSIEKLDKEKEIGKKGPEEIIKWILASAKKHGLEIHYTQNFALAAFKDKVWSPTLVHEKLATVVPLVNQSRELPENIFLQRTLEFSDDVPVVRILVGPGDPYTAERIGSLAFYSTQRAMEWYAKLHGPQNFQPNQGQVFVTCYDDETLKEEPCGQLNLEQSDEEWVRGLVAVFNNEITAEFEDGDEEEEIVEYFFDSLTKRRIVQMGPHYFDPSLPNMDDLEYLIQNRKRRAEAARQTTFYRYLGYQFPLDLNPYSLEQGDCGEGAYFTTDQEKTVNQGIENRDPFGLLLICRIQPKHPLAPEVRKEAPDGIDALNYRSAGTEELIVPKGASPKCQILEVGVVSNPGVVSELANKLRGCRRFGVNAVYFNPNQVAVADRILRRHFGRGLPKSQEVAFEEAVSAKEAKAVIAAHWTKAQTALLQIKKKGPRRFHEIVEASDRYYITFRHTLYEPQQYPQFHYCRMATASLGSWKLNNRIQITVKETESTTNCYVTLGLSKREARLITRESNPARIKDVLIRASYLWSKKGGLDVRSNNRRQEGRTRQARKT